MDVGTIIDVRKTVLRGRPRRRPCFPQRAGIIMTGWLALLAAGLFEIAWAFGLKYSDGLTRFWPTVATALAILASFSLMAFALRSLPFGTAYAIWTGIGAAGSIIIGMVIFSEPTDPVRIICLTLIIAGMVGLKLNSPV
jgi:quaternary ammonium compound-resistance protein SugE